MAGGVAHPGVSSGAGDGVKPYWTNGIASLYYGDVREVLECLPEQSVHTCVTSPPYWGLRDYGMEGQLGLEPTPEAYIENMVSVFRAVWRVLRDDGTLFLNLGDSYYSNPGNGRGGGSTLAGGKPHLSGAARGARNGTDDKEQSDFASHETVSESLCDECVAVLASRNLGIDIHHARAPEPSVSESTRSHKEQQIDHSGSSHSASQGDRNADAISNLERLSILAGARPPSSQESMPAESSGPRLEDCLHCASCGACQDVILSANPYALACARTGWHFDKNGNDENGHPSGSRSLDRASSRKAYPYYTTASLKPKDLVGIPWRVALALQADGWYLRSDIIWSKPNPMPESVTDRPTKAHEYLFLLTKQPRYYYDQEAIREPATVGNHPRTIFDNGPKETPPGTGPHNGLRYAAGAETGRNKRTVWEIATQPYSEAHFATFPEKLVEPCILAGTSERGVCPECGAPWERVVERKHYGNVIPHADLEKGKTRNNMGGQQFWDKEYVAPQTTGWRPTCDHGLEPVAATVCDPFAGSATTCVVANRLGRRSVGIDISGDYLKLAVKRMSAEPLSLFVGAEA